MSKADIVYNQARDARARGMDAHTDTIYGMIQGLAQALIDLETETKQGWAPVVEEKR